MTPRSGLNYFTCTLGQATLPGVTRPFQNVNDLIDQQARQLPDSPAVGFYQPKKNQSTYVTRILTFNDVRNGILHTAHTIRSTIVIEGGQTVGLLCNSSPAFLFTWLALTRLGHPVLLIAPQCSASAIVHLSKACNAQLLFHDQAYEKLANEAHALAPNLQFPALSTQQLPFEDDDEVFSMIDSGAEIDVPTPSVSNTDVAYLHHTSGTSTGIPKPIPQSHHAGVGVLPALDGSLMASFTTTPLYHGGVADLFRAWTSSAQIWLFPAQHVPITATNIVKCLEASDSTTKVSNCAPIKYFSSVPYVLQMMAQDESGLALLQKMDLVGVGGAALPPEVGEKLVTSGVNLISRYGSAECGFLMSSYRNFGADREWQYLRRPDEIQQLRFERQEGGQSELVISPGWPHMAKTNREDGSFATSDLFAPHPALSNAWKYHSRADSQLTLVTGKKFDPAPLEGSLAASTTIVSEVLIFGNGKPYPGALLFRSEGGKDCSDEELIDLFAPIVENINVESQSHARIPRNMLIPMPYEVVPLDKSSKGTILRGQAEEKYSEHIENAYSKTVLANGDVQDKDLPSTISNIIETVVGGARHDKEELSSETDLFSYGVDSVACVQIRHALSQLLPKDANTLPMTIVEDSGTISQLSATIVKLRKGEQIQHEESSGPMLKSLIKEYSAFKTVPTTKLELKDNHKGKVVLLTGPTGMLGAQILSLLLSDSKVKKVYLLVRGATTAAAKERVTKALSSRKLPIPADFDDRTSIMPCKFSDSKLGLSDTDYETLADEVDTILHLAWSVNFVISVRSIASTHLAGLHNLLQFALVCKQTPKFVFCSSVASVSNFSATDKIPEAIVEDLSSCGSTGYSQSKLAAELICSRCATDTDMRGRITIIRVGQLSGDTGNGVWNASEAYPLMLASSNATGVLPDLQNESLAWLPVDIAAKAYLEAAFAGGEDTGRSRGSNNEAVRVLHLLNTDESTTFSDLTRCIVNSGQKLSIVSLREWLLRLEQLQQNKDTEQHPALKLLSFWQDIYGSDSGQEKVLDQANEVESFDRYEMDRSIAAMPSFKDGIGPLSEDYMLKLWSWIRENC